jgi:inosine/xanthosine triphosphate pyrophosphatase family protein
MHIFFKAGIQSLSIKGRRMSPQFYGRSIQLTVAGSYAEMDKVGKNEISHRFRALQKLKKWLEES